MIGGLELVITLLKAAGCRTIYVDGSFISSKEKPGDFDACWEEEGVDITSLKSIAPTLYNFTLQRVEQKRKYKGEIFPANYPANDSGIVYIDFFQFRYKNKYTQRHYCYRFTKVGTMIIKNDEQYQNSLNYLHKFEQSVAEIENNESLKSEPTRYNLYKDSYQSQVDEFKQEIAEYERLINCNQSQSITIKVESFNKLPDVLIKARIAAKMTHKELADILSIDVDRVKEYEQSDYQCASFVEILGVSAALGVEFTNATVQVDFEEIEEGKKSAEKWRQWREEKNIIKTKAS